MLTPEAISEFKRLYQKEYGIQLTDAEAVNMGIKLIRLVKIVYGSDLPKKWVPRRNNDDTIKTEM